MTQEATNSTPSIGQQLPADSRNRVSGYIHSLKKVEPSTSAPSDSDWVSPFTLPPLAPLSNLQSRRRQSTLVTSPDRHQRTSSSAYYAAAWGSPYATPSPRRSPQLSRRSLSFQDSSPAANENRWADFADTSAPQAGGSISSVKRVGRLTARERRKRASIGLTATSERPNWLSDSDESNLSNTNTPKRALFAQDPLLPNRSIAATISGHSINESVATITQDSFGRFPDSARQGLAMEDSPVKEKALPSIPARKSISERLGSFSNSPASRPKIVPAESFQRPKKKVLWKGKACIIALPLDDGSRFEEYPLLTPADVQERLRTWQKEGYDTRGFTLTDLSYPSTLGSGQSRSLYPDPMEMTRERQNRVFNVSIPNQADWEAWVEHLKEEKLRALGVTSSNSEAPASTRSPFSASMSRASSQYPSMPISPDQGPFGATINQGRVGSNPFAPPFIRSPGASSQVSAVSPVYDGVAGSRHGYKQSIAQQGMQARMTSPFDFAVSQPNMVNRSARSPPNYFNQRQMSISPGGRGLQSLGEVLLPSSPFQSEGLNHSPNSNAMFEQMRREQEAQAQMVRQQQATQSQSYQKSLPVTPAAATTSKPSLEIAHPTPRSHRHNLSEALQKEIDDAETIIEDRERQQQAAVGITLNNVSAIATKDETESEGMLHDEELPIIPAPNLTAEADNKSDIETNPSVAASPMLMDDRNPLASWQSKDLTSQSQYRSTSPAGHKVKPSMSKLNVKAKEFDPKGVFTSSSFVFGNQSFNPFGTDRGAQVPLFASSADQPTVNPFTTPPAKPHLNVAAPAFTPLAATVTAPVFTPMAAQSQSTPPTQGSSKFIFSSATFNVEAPEFNPSKSFGSSVDGPALPTADANVSSTRIFGDVVIDPSSKTTRRGSKAVPIIRPTSKDSPQDAPEDEPEEDDEDERPRAPIERQKRARHADSDGDRAPVFAASAPFLQKGASEIVDEDVRDENSEETNPQTGDQPQPDFATGKEPSEFIFKDEIDAARFNDALPSSLLRTSSPSQEVANDSAGDAVFSSNEDDDVSMDVTGAVPGSLGHKSRSSLSALAKPFVFARYGPDDFPKPPVSDVASKSRPSMGLEASRFATMSNPSSPVSPDQYDETLSAQMSGASRDEPLVETLAPPPVKSRSWAFEEELASDADNQQLASGSDAADQSPPRSRQGMRDELSDGPLLPNEPGPLRGPLQVMNPSTSDNEIPIPSYEEIDAVMKQFEDHPELGVERLDTPPVRSTPLADMQLRPNLRSDAPSPSPRRLETSKADMTGGEYHWLQPKLGPGDTPVHRLTTGNEPVSDWNDALSPVQIDKLESRAFFFDGRVNDLVDGILENRLGPLEKTLKTIQNSVSLLTTGPKSGSVRRSMSTDVKESDADDEDDYDAFEGWSAYRSRSPEMKKDRKADRVKAAVMEAFAAQQAPVQERTQTELDDIRTILAEMRHSYQRPTSQSDPAALKAMVEEVIATHPRLSSQRDEKSVVVVSELENMLKVAEERAESEARSCRAAEDELVETQRRLQNLEEEAARHRAASEEAERSLSAFVKEKEAYQDLEEESQNLKWKIAALETTLEEYRVSSDKWRDDIQEHRARNRDLNSALSEAKEQLEERSQSRQALRSKVERLHEEMLDIVKEVASNQAEWRQREHELINKNNTAHAILEHEVRHREKLELELDESEKERKENIRYKSTCGFAEQEVSRLQDLVASLRDESQRFQNRAFHFEREHGNLKDNSEGQVSKATASLQIELARSKSETSSMRADFEAQIARLQNRVDHVELDIEEQKGKHESELAEKVEAHNQALQEATEKREDALQEQHAAHEKKLTDLRERHTRALHNSSDDRHRLEHHLNEKLTLSDDKVQHLESKVENLEERLEITKSAARAAVEAATAKGINLPTPAPSTVASPPHLPQSRASVSFARGSDIPEKISPQALRESIMVLQDQLQNREQSIEKLEAELSAVDKEAPNKIRDQETEIGWLRELLSVRVDDIEDIINTLTKPDFDKEAAKDAAIRLKANLQMEQQLKERAATGLTLQLPSIATLTNLTQSPRALPMAAAAAWGNWRKSSSFGALSDIATNLSQTPSRAVSGSPSSFLSGIMTPPSTTARTPVPGDSSIAPPTMRPLANAARKSSTEARPLRSYNSQPRALSSKQLDKRPASQQNSHRHPEPPSTPPLMTHGSYDGDADVKSLTGDLDADASPLDGKENRSFAEPMSS